MPDRPQRTPLPHSRLTRICEAMTHTFERHPEFEVGDKAVLFLVGKEDGQLRSGIVIENYDEDGDALVDLLEHIRTIFHANGTDLQIVGIPNDLGDLDGLTGG